MPATRAARTRPRAAELRGVAARRRQFTEQLQLLLDTGMALLPALESIRRQSRDAVLIEVLTALATDIGQGRSFADALARHARLFPVTYVTLIAAAEQGGYLQRVLRHLIVVEEKRAALVAMLKSAFSYPLFLITFSMAVVVFVLAVVFPRFAELFAGIATELPLTTRALMWASDLLAGHLFWLAPLALVFAAAAALWLLSPAGTQALHEWASRVPGLRGIMVRVYLVQMLRTLSLSLGNGVTLPDALEACREVAPTREFRALVAGVIASVQEGQGAAAVFREATMLPQLTRQMLETGEESGELGMVSERLADHYQLELERSLATLGRLLEPTLLLVMGVLVGVIVASLILPVFKLAHAVH
ncbi:MAG: type II secretion system F family protein [Gammaproteobacteria bacterium]